MTDNILVTGGLGFIGSNLVRYLLDNTDLDVTVLDRLDEAGDQNRLASAMTAGPRLRVIWHDLRAPISFYVGRQIGSEFRYIVHAAAASHVTRSVQDPVGFLYDNAIGTAHLLQYARAVEPEKVLYFSTDEVFGPAPDGVTFDEYSAHNPNNPYAASKAAGEALCPAWANTYGTPISVTHCTNVYGPGQHDEKFIPTVVRKVLRGEVVQIHADPTATIPSTRFYVHVDDVSRAVLAVLKRGGTIQGLNSGKFNISGDMEYSNLDVAQRIAELLGRELHHELIARDPSRPKHDMAYRVDSTSLEALGWSPRIGLDDGLRLTVPILAEQLRAA